MYKSESWVWQQKESPLQLEKTQKHLQDLDDDSVLIENKAIGLNPVDWKLMKGFSDSWKKNQIPGVDGMGIIVSVGKNMTHLRIGTRVMYHTDLRYDGSFSFYTVVKGFAVIPVPDFISDITAASLPCPGLTAIQAINKLNNFIGENVLVNGAGGAVGNLITQILIAKGSKVYATSSSKHHDKLMAYGVVEVFDYLQPNWKLHFSKTFGEKSLHAVIDTVSQESAISLSHLLGYYGHLVCVQDRVENAPLPAFTTSISLHEVALASIHVFGTPIQWGHLRNAGIALLNKIGAGEIVLNPIEAISFDDIPSALNDLKYNNNGKKYVAVID